MNSTYRVRFKPKAKLRLITSILVVIVVCSAIVYGSKNFESSVSEVTISHFTAVAVNAVYEAESRQRVAPFFPYTVYFRDTSDRLKSAGSMATVKKDMVICIESMAKQRENISYRVVESSKCT